MTMPTWALAVESIVPPPSEELVCSICQAVFDNPVQCPCSHVFCNECITRWLITHPNCPICRKTSRVHTLEPVNPIIRNIISKLVVKCRNTPAGCESTVTVENADAHIRDCLYEEIDCPRNCGLRMQRKDALVHAETDCSMCMVDCVICELTVPGKLGEHNCIDLLKQKNAESKKKIAELEEENTTLKRLLALPTSSVLQQWPTRHPSVIELDDDEENNDVSDISISSVSSFSSGSLWNSIDQHLDSVLIVNSSSSCSSSNSLSSINVLENHQTVHLDSSSSDDRSSDTAETARGAAEYDLSFNDLTSYNDSPSSAARRSPKRRLISCLDGPTREPKSQSSTISSADTSEVAVQDPIPIEAAVNSFLPGSTFLINAAKKTRYDRPSGIDIPLGRTISIQLQGRGQDAMLQKSDPSSSAHGAYKSGATSSTDISKLVNASSSSDSDEATSTTLPRSYYDTDTDSDWTPGEDDD